MFTSLKKGATAAATVLALSLTVSLVQVNAAAARGKATIEPESLDLKNAESTTTSSASSQRRHFKRSARSVCCALPRSGKMALTRPADCKKAKGKILPPKQCPQAGAKASDAYFVRVDRSTTTQSSAAESATGVDRRRGGTIFEDQ